MRLNNRAADQIRLIKHIPDYCNYAVGSLLLELGDTRIIVAVTVSNSVPQFLRGTGQGWLTASYSLLPMSCRVRVERESAGKRNERSVEISRLIGRVLRSVINLKDFGEKTIYVDCDVVQADGGTRSAAITAACYALRQVELLWLKTGHITKPLLRDVIAAISVGIVNEEILLDLDYHEDARALADFNFVMTRSGNFVEVQGTAEKNPISWHQIETMKEFAFKGITDIFDILDFSQHQMQDKFQSIPA